MCLFAAAALVAVTAAPAHAVLVHRYMFNGNVCDCVGGAHGTIVDPGAPTAVFTAGGQLDLSANSGNATEDAYVDLPNHIIQNAARSGQSGAFSLVWWFTISEARTWQRLGDFSGPTLATPPGGEDVLNNGNVNSLFVTPSSGRLNQGLDMWNNYNPTDADGDNTYTAFGLSGPTAPGLPSGVQHYVVAVYDNNDTSGGANPGGTMHLYLNGAEILPGDADVIGSNAIYPGLDLNNLGDHDNWLGRSQWPDPMFDGKFNEFSIYDHALTPVEVLEPFIYGGPDPLPLPTLIVNTVTGQTAIKNPVINCLGGPVTIDYYEIASAAGRLNPADGAWNSLSDQGIDAGLAADFDDSGAVDNEDLAVWQDGANAPPPCIPSPTAGDADFDGDADGLDFLVWQQQLGQLPGEGDSWDEEDGVNDHLLAEQFLNGGTTLAPGEQLDLGTPFRPGGAQDVTFQFGVKGEPGLIIPGSVQYVSTGPVIGVPEPATLLGGIAGIIGLETWRLRRRVSPRIALTSQRDAATGTIRRGT
jgi:hypothetical protein